MIYSKSKRKLLGENVQEVRALLFLQTTDFHLHKTLLFCLIRIKFFSKC